MSKVNRRIVVTGGRDFDDIAVLSEALDYLAPTELYVGDAAGADRLARDWANLNGVGVTLFRADWNKHGRAAGPIRNRAMLDSAGPEAVVVAFPGGKGTANCVKQATELNLLVLRVEE